MLINGYHANEEATKKASRNGYISVGDLGYFDEGSRLYVVDRKIDMVISGGVKVYPLEIEQSLHQYPKIGDCAVRSNEGQFQKEQAKLIKYF